MSIVATCSCGESFGAPVSMAGKKARCPSCGEVLEIPESTEQLDQEIDDEFDDDEFDEEDSTESLLEDALTEGGQRVDSILPIEAQPATDINRKPSDQSSQNKAQSASQRPTTQRSTAQRKPVTSERPSPSKESSSKQPSAKRPAPGTKATGGHVSSKGDAARSGAARSGAPKGNPAKQASPTSASGKPGGGKASTPKKTPSKNPQRTGIIDRKTAPPAPTKSEPVVALQKPGGNAADLGTNDVFDLGDLSSLESPPSDPLALPSAGQPSPRPATAPKAAHWNTPQQAPPKSNMGLILGIVGGGVAIVLIAVVAGVVVILMSQGNDNDGGDEQVAQNNTSSTTDQPSGSANGGNPGGVSSDNGNGQFGNGANVGPLGPGGGSGTGFGGSDSNTTEDINRFGRDDDDDDGDNDAGGADTTDSADSGFGGSGDSSDASMIEASNNWHSQEGRRLRGTIDVPDVDLVIFRYSWLCDLLPHMGYQDVHDKLDFDAMFIELSNRPASETIIPQFLNPLDDRERTSDIRFPDFALTHFAGMSGVEDLPNDLAAEYPRSHPLAGIFGYDEIAKRDDITDGLGETIMIVGTGRIVQPWVAGGGATIRGARPPYFGKYNGLGSIGLPEPGVIVVFADGTIRHISADIDPKVFKALCTIHGAESVDMNHEAIGQPNEDWFNR